MNEQNNKSKNIIGIIVQAGAVGIALVAVYLMYNLASNHISESNNYMRKNTEVLSELKEAIFQSTETDKEQIRVLGDLDRTIQINFSK